ncbi:hypothetical protein Plhal703r1_c32g0123771 [Plasmopara halstedii]
MKPTLHHKKRPGSCRVLNWFCHLFLFLHSVHYALRYNLLRNHGRVASHLLVCSLRLYKDF